MLLFLGLIAMSLVFLWSLYFRAYYMVHLYPLMLILVFASLSLLVPGWRTLPEAIRRAMVVFGLAYFIAYPSAKALWDEYRHPAGTFGRFVVIHFLDYHDMAAGVAARVDPDGIVASDMAHEVSWLTGRRTIAMPNTEVDLQIIVEKYDVDALLEHPVLFREWGYIERNFELVDTANGRLWVRR